MKTTAARILGSAIAGVVALSSPLTAAPAAPDAQTNVPVKAVVLFSSGVGYFEHFGEVNNNSTTVLHFKTEQINDILKSLLLQDLDQGTVNAVTYPAQGPVEHTLKSFQLDLTSNPSLSELLQQLRGAKVTVTLAQGARQIEGTVLGVEMQKRAVKDKDQLQDVAVVNLVQDGGILPVELSQVSDVKIQDPELRKELTAALLALSQARDKDKKPVEIHFSGQGQRRVRIGYVVETPVWKTSYRLILPSGDVPVPKGDKGADTDREQKQDVGKAKADATNGAIQGWAIVENQTDSDWKDVQLSLVSGRPISFIENLYQPLYIPRPVVEPELFASLRPQTYTQGLVEKQAREMELSDRGADAADKAGAPPAAPMAAAAAPRQLQANRLKRSAGGFGLGAGEGGANGREELRKSIDVTKSVSSIASAAKVGELFQYTVGNVSISRQQSAMLPIVTDNIQVEKLSIYNYSVLPNNPLLGARIKNTSGKYLLQGPITVLSGGSYAGDANIQDLPPGQERLISYGIDQEVTVHANRDNSSRQLLTGKIVKGILRLTYKEQFTQEYKAEDKSDAPKALIIEAPRRQGWKLIEPVKALETTDTLYRFEGKLKPHEVSKISVKEERTDIEQFAILPADSGDLLMYVRAGEIPQDVKDALGKAISLKGAVTDTQRQQQVQQQKIQEITNEQTRIRENMKAVSPSSEYYKRLLKELDDQETTIQDLHKQVQTLQKQQDQQRKELEDYLGSLNVG